MLFDEFDAFSFLEKTLEDMKKTITSADELEKRFGEESMKLILTYIVFRKMQGNKPNVIDLINGMMPYYDLIEIFRTILVRFPDKEERKKFCDEIDTSDIPK